MRDVERLANGDAEESWRSDADDIEEIHVDAKAGRRSQLRGSHLALPVFVADDGDARRTGRQFVGGLDEDGRDAVSLRAC